MSLIHYLVVKYAIIVRLNIQNTFIASSLSAVCCSLPSKCLNLSGGFQQLWVKHFSHSAHNNHFMWKQKLYLQCMEHVCTNSQTTWETLKFMIIECICSEKGISSYFYCTNNALKVCFRCTPGFKIKSQLSD